MAAAARVVDQVKSLLASLERTRDVRDGDAFESTDHAAVDASALSVEDIADLRDYWHDAHAKCGVRSNFGAMCEAVNIYGSAALAHARRRDREYRRRRRELIARYGEERVRTEQREHVERLVEAKRAASGSWDGIEGERVRAAVFFDDDADRLTSDEIYEAHVPVPLRYDGMVTATGRVSHVTSWEDPVTDEMIGFPRKIKGPAGRYTERMRFPPEGTIARATRVGHTLRRAGSRATVVLFAVYSPARGDDVMRALRKRFGDLAEMVVAIVRASRADVTPRTIVCAKCGEAYPDPAQDDADEETDARVLAFLRSKDPSFVRMQKRNAEKLIAWAGERYVEAKQ